MDRQIIALSHRELPPRAPLTPSFDGSLRGYHFNLLCDNGAGIGPGFGLLYRGGAQILLQPEKMKLLDRSPFLFAVAKKMTRSKVPGGWKLLAILDRLGYLDNKIFKHQVKQNYWILIPAYNPDRWDGLDLLDYEQRLIAALAEASSQCVGPLTVVDCGANIGLISIFLAARLDLVSKVVAFEPNDEIFPILRQALAGLPIEAEAIHMAVSDFNGRGELRSPSYDSSDYARYVVQVPQGGFPVTTVDDLSLKAANLLIKIDVEGSEIAVIRGASRSLAQAEKAILSIEAHPDVFKRTGIEPIAILREIAAIRPFQFTVAETGEANLDLSRPFFEQQPNDGTVYNIVCVSR